MKSFLKSRKKAPEVEEEEEETEGDNSLSPGQIVFYGSGSRNLLMLNEVDPDSGAALISQLFQLDDEEAGAPICLHINTPGGCMDTMWAICDTIRMIESPVVAIVIGLCASAGLGILTACDYRTATPNSRFFYHQPLCGKMIDSKENVDSLVASYEYNSKLYNDFIFKRSKMSKAVWKREFEGRRDKDFQSPQALEWGIIDDICQFTKKVKIKIERQSDVEPRGRGENKGSVVRKNSSKDPK